MFESTNWMPIIFVWLGMFALALSVRLSHKSKFLTKHKFGLRSFVVFAALLAIYFTSTYVMETMCLPDVDYRLLVLVFVLFDVSDWFSTKKALNFGAKEANPLIRFLIRKIGINLTLPITLAFWILFVVFYLRYMPTFIQLSLVVMYFAVIVNNVTTLIIKKRKAISKNI